jgi:hypothetical protein
LSRNVNNYFRTTPQANFYQRVRRPRKNILRIFSSVGGRRVVPMGASVLYSSDRKNTNEEYSVRERKSAVFDLTQASFTVIEPLDRYAGRSPLLLYALATNGHQGQLQ